MSVWRALYELLRIIVGAFLATAWAYGLTWIAIALAAYFGAPEEARRLIFALMPLAVLAGTAFVFAMTRKETPRG